MASVEDALYNAFSQAETGSVKDPWIRTMYAPAGGSTAYGPVQITRTLAEDYLKRYKDIFSQEEIDYLNRFIDQGKMFAKFGKEPNRKGYDPRYDYGGTGDLTSPQDKALYESVAKKMLMKQYEDNKGNLEDTIKQWRFGSASKEGRKADERYFKTVENTFMSQPDQPTQSYPQIDPTDFLNNLTEILRQRIQGDQSGSQTPSQGDTQPQQQENPTDKIINALSTALKSKRQANEEKLARTANEAKLEAEAKKAGYEPKPSAGSDGLIQKMSKLQVIRSGTFDRSNLNKDTVNKDTQTSGRTNDPSKDPTYGIF